MNTYRWAPQIELYSNTLQHLILVLTFILLVGLIPFYTILPVLPVPSTLWAALLNKVINYLVANTIAWWFIQVKHCLFHTCWFTGIWILLRLLTFFFFLGHATKDRILVPLPGMEPVPPAVEPRSPNHWTTREFLLRLLPFLLSSSLLTPPL